MQQPIGAVANELGVSVDALRYYEKAGLADPPTRDSGGRRRYSAAEIEWLRFLLRMRSTGMPIRLLQTYAAARRLGDPGAGRRREILHQHRGDVVARIDELEQCVAFIDHKIENYARVEADLAATRRPTEVAP